MTSTDPKNKTVDLSQESWDADYSQVWDGVYTINEPHIPGGFSAMGFINNRAFLLRVDTPDLGTHFLMSGIPSHNCIDKAKKLEQDTGIPLKVIVTSGDFHHMAMKYWLEAYPDTKFIHSSLKFPHTRNGTDILKNPKFKQQIELVNGDDDSLCPSLKVYSKIVQFYGFNQCLTLPDKEFMSSDSKNLTTNSTFSYLKNIAGEANKADVPFLCIWLYHVPSKTLVFEHNFQIYINRHQKKHLKMLGKMLLPIDLLGSVGKGPVPKLPATEKACTKHCQQMQVCMELEVLTMMDYHCTAGMVARSYGSSMEYRREMRVILSATGEDIPDGSGLLQYMNSKGNFLCC